MEGSGREDMEQGNPADIAVLEDAFDAIRKTRVRRSMD
jgi:hypothetical protein